MTIHFNETRYNNYIDCLLNKDNKNLYMKYIINNVNIDEFDKIFNNYIISHNKKFDLYYINCEFEIETNKDLVNIEINFHHNTDYINLRGYLFFYTHSREIKNFNINQISINIISCLSNMTYECYLTNSMSFFERRINFIISKGPQLINALNRNKNQPLIRKYNYIPFKNI